MIWQYSSSLIWMQDSLLLSKSCLWAFHPQKGELQATYHHRCLDGLEAQWNVKVFDVGFSSSRKQGRAEEGGITQTELDHVINTLETVMLCKICAWIFNKGNTQWPLKVFPCNNKNLELLDSYSPENWGVYFYGSWQGNNQQVIACSLILIWPCRLRM